MPRPIAHRPAPSAPAARRGPLAWFAPLLALALLAACSREPAPAPVAGDPVAAVQGLAAALRDNDLQAYARLSLPPDLLARREAEWARSVATAAPAGPEDAEEYAKLMARLTAPDAEAALMRDLEPKLAKFESESAGQWPLMQGTARIFLNAAIQANTELSADEKDHATAVVASLLDWAQPALFTDRERAREAIAAAVQTARDLDLPTLDAARALPMQPALAKGGQALAGFKRMARAYDLDLDASLDGVQARLLESRGDAATVEVSYPLLGDTQRFEMELLKRGDGWYPASDVREAEALPTATGAAVDAAGAD